MTLKLLITGSLKGFHRELTDVLGTKYAIRTASDGVQTLQLLRSYQPDILLLDLQLPRLDGIAVLQQIRVENMQVKVLAVLSIRSAYVDRMLRELMPDYVLVAPCSVTVAAARIHSLAEMIQGDVRPASRARRRLADMLMLLGINPDSEGGRLLSRAIMIKYNAPESLITKDIYPELVRNRETEDWKYAERNIRSAIAAAWKRRNPQVWCYYFPEDEDVKAAKPSNQVFIARLAQLLSLQDE